jgi:hypothetical protein
LYFIGPDKYNLLYLVIYRRTPFPEFAYQVANPGIKFPRKYGADNLFLAPGQTPVILNEVC